MLSELIGKKLQMTQIWNEAGEVVPVTVVQAGPCDVIQVKTDESRDGYRAVQLGFGEVKSRKQGKLGSRLNKPRRGHFEKAGVDPRRVLQEVELPEGVELKAGDTVTVEIFKDATKVDVTGTTKGRGFQGVVKRHDFSRGPKSHGSKHYRGPGSTGACQAPSRVRKGKKLAGQFGNTRCTIQGLEVVRVDADRNLMYIKGAVPGPSGGTLRIRRALKASS